LKVMSAIERCRTATLGGLARCENGDCGYTVIAYNSFRNRRRWVCDKAGDIAIVMLARDVLDQATEETTGRDPRSVEIIPKFLIRGLMLERIAHQLLSGIARPEARTRLRYAACLSSIRSLFHLHDVDFVLQIA